MTPKSQYFFHWPRPWNLENLYIAERTSQHRCPPLPFHGVQNHTNFCSMQCLLLRTESWTNLPEYAWPSGSWKVVWFSDIYWTGWSRLNWCLHLPNLTRWFSCSAKTERAEWSVGYLLVSRQNRKCVQTCSLCWKGTRRVSHIYTGTSV